MIVEHDAGDGLALGQTVRVVDAELHTAPDATQAGFLGRGAEAAKGACRPLGCFRPDFEAARIAEDRREDIFLPFYTTHKGGSGVGLSFARQVALAHGGSICALDAPEGGANLRMVI